MTDPAAVTRWGSVLDVPDDYLRCLAWRHRWDPGPVVERAGWGATVWEVRASCDCGRRRVDTLAPGSGALLARDYGGGHGFLPGAEVTAADARAEWSRRSRARASGVVDVGSRRRARRTG